MKGGGVAVLLGKSTNYIDSHFTRCSHSCWASTPWRVSVSLSQLWSSILDITARHGHGQQVVERFNLKGLPHSVWRLRPDANWYRTGDGIKNLSFERQTRDMILSVLSCVEFFIMGN